MEEIIPEYWKNLSIENIIYINDEGIECEEKWLPVVGYEGLYEVSDCGRIKSIARLAYPNLRGQRVLKTKIKPSFNDKDYRRVELSKEGINNKYFVHRLVALSFLPNPESKNDINHKFGIVWDNRVSQIEWATESENAKHSYDILKRKPSPSWLKGKPPEMHPMFGKKGKLAPLSKPIICNETGKQYDSIRDAAKELNIKETTLKYVLTGVTKKSKIGYTFKYVING